LISLQLPAPLPARRAYRPEGRAYSSERGVEFTIETGWNDGMVASGSESLRIGENNGILGIKNG
jgi:hypothetical protein